MKLTERIGTVKNSTDLAAFINALRDDLVENPDEWENPTLERFLESLAAWLEDMDLKMFYRKPDLTPDHIEWRYVADMLYAAKVYE